MIVVLVVLVVASCATQYILTYLSSRSLNQTVNAFVDMMKHEADLRHIDLARQRDYEMEELASRERLAVQGMRTPMMPDPMTQWPGQGYDGGLQAGVDPDPLHLDDLSEYNIPVPPSYAEQNQGGFALPSDRLAFAEIRPGESIIPGDDEQTDLNPNEVEGYPTF